ncbi:hypothetical protein [Prosthecobacter sp.]|uniref:hypothetical protein n=1 Tax=Prosthecobacter sp. TaxID=1965333 RepID=UPI003782E309
MFLSCCVALLWLCEGGAEAEEMKTRVFQVPRDFLTVVNDSVTPGLRDADPFWVRELPARKADEPMLLIVTARDHLEASGITFPAGASASYDLLSSKLTVINTQANLDLCETYVQSSCNLCPKQLSFVLTVVEGPGEIIRQANEAAAAQEDAAMALAELMQQTAKEQSQVRVVGEAFVQAYSGTRATTRSVKEHEHLTIGSDEQGRLSVNHEIQMVGLNLEFDPVIEADGQHIDLAYTLDLHPAPPSEKQVAVSDSTTGGAGEIPLTQVPRLHFGADTQMLGGSTRLLGMSRPYGKAGAEGEDVLWAAFLTAHVVRLDGLPRAQPKVPAAAMKVPTGMKKLAYPVPSGLFENAGRHPAQKVQSYLEAHGIAPAAGADAIMKGEVLTAVNTHENLERIVLLVEHLTSKLPKTAVVTLHTVKGSGAFLRGLAAEAAAMKDHGGQWSRVQEALKAGSYELKAVGTSRLESTSGQRAKLESVQEHRFFAGYGKDDKGRVGPQFETRSVGAILEFEPLISMGSDVDISLSHELHPLPLKPGRGMVQEPGTKEKQSFPIEDLPVQQTVTQLHVESGGVRLLSLLRPPGGGAEDQLLATFLECEVMSHSSARKEKGPSLEQMMNSVPTSKSVSQTMYVRSFRVSPDFLHGDVNKSSKDETFPASSIKSAREILEDAGIPFPEGARVSTGGPLSDLIVRNTTENLDKVEQFVKWMERECRPSAVAMTSQVLEVPGPLLRGLMSGLGSRSNHRAELEQLLAGVKLGTVKHLGLLRIETRAGTHGRAEQGVKHPFFTGALENDVRVVGFRTEVGVDKGTPYAAPQFRMETEFHPAGPLEHREYVIDSQGRRLEFPLTDFHVMKLSATTFIPDGNARMLAVWKPVGKAEWEKGDVLQVLFVSCDEVLTRE